MTSIQRTWKTPSALISMLEEQQINPKGICDDSRQIKEGDIFLAYPGDFADGRKYITDAVSKGASAILWDPCGDFQWNSGWNIPNFAVEELRSYCGPLANAILAYPSERLSLLAVTGTNGKTTITQWISRLYPRACAVVGTLGAGFPEKLLDTGLTTPGAVTLANYLAQFASEEAKACALEASSIGIEEGRMDGLRVDVAVFTNLTRDHLDYHGSMEAYANAKMKLFTWPKLRLAVINIDDPFGEELAKCTTASKVIVYSHKQATHPTHTLVHTEDVKEAINGMKFKLCTPNGRSGVETGLVGHFNISNLLAVACVLVDAGLKPSEIAERFASLTAPPGRLEKVGGHNEPLIVVDYSHTPDSLENALLALRGIAQARGAKLTVVFGCGGNRDHGKRPIMGEIAARLADKVVITSDNPRNEDPQSIIDEIHPGAPDAIAVVDRRQAITQTVLEAHPAEVILLAGKGHEPYQEIKGVRHHFSDIEEAQIALNIRKETLSCKE